MTLKDIADRLGGQVLAGSPDLEISGVSGVELAAATELSFFESPKYRKAALRTSAAALLVRDSREGYGGAQIRVSHPYLQFLAVVKIFHPVERPAPGIHETVVIDPTARLHAEVSVGPWTCIEAGVTIGKGTVIGPNVFLGRGVSLGQDCWLHPNVVVRHECLIGDRVTLHAGTVVGADGFGYVRTPTSHEKIPHVGRVRVEEDVEIGANSTIDRGTFGDTVIEQGAKLDNLVQVGHNVRVGARSILCAQVGVAGSSEVGADCVLAGQVGVADHVTIGDASIFTGQTGVARDVKSGAVMSGSPAIENRNWLRSSTIFMKLPELLSRVRKIEKMLKERAD